MEFGALLANKNFILLGEGGGVREMGKGSEKVKNIHSQDTK